MRCSRPAQSVRPGLGFPYTAASSGALRMHLMRCCAFNWWTAQTRTHVLLLLILGGTAYYRFINNNIIDNQSKGIKNIYLPIEESMEMKQLCPFILR